MCLRSKRILIVDDHPSLRRTLARELEARGAAVEACGSVAAAREALARCPDLLILDVELEDGTAFDVLEAASRLSPCPTVVAMSGVAGPEQSFRLAQLGVRQYLRKPITLAAVERAVEEALASPPDLVPHVRAAVGHVPVRELEEKVRATMLEEALARSRGNRRRAASLLGISRQLLQHIVRSRRGS